MTAVAAFEQTHTAPTPPVIRWPRAVLHADLDAFYASAEVARSPTLRGLPVVVGGGSGAGRTPNERGVVASASYEARACGVRAAMPLAEARRRCPALVVVPPDGAYYARLSAAFLDLLHTFTPDVQPTGPDEAALDVTGFEQISGAPESIAERIRQRVRDELGLAVTIGLATSRVVAKIAAKEAKPDGFRIVLPGAEAAFLAPLPVSAMPGIGPATRSALLALGVTTLGQLAARTDATLYTRFGDLGPALARRARGVDDDAPFVSGGVVKSIGHSRTLDKPTKERETLRATLAALCDDTATELRRQELTARTVTLRVRRADFRTVTMRRTLPVGTDAGQTLLAVVTMLLEPCVRELNHGRVRQLGVRVSKLVHGARQLGFWDESDRRHAAINTAIDTVRARHGKAAVRPAITLLAAREAPPDAVFAP